MAGGSGGGPDDGVDRWLTEFHGQNDRLRSELEEARARLGRLSRNSDVPRATQRAEPDLHPVAPTLRERPEIVGLADRLRVDAESAARLLLEFERQRGTDAVEPLRLARDEIETLRADRDRVQAESDALAREVASLRAELDRRQAQAIRPPDRLPILSKDFARWSSEPTARQVVTATVAVAVAVAVAVGPDPLPPTLDDLDAVDRLIESVRRLGQTPVVVGKPFHALFDDKRFQALQTKLREASLLADRLISQVERSKTNKELLWHLMVARKNDELQRNKRR